MCHSGRIYKDLCEAEMTENLCRKSIKNAVEVKEYQTLRQLIRPLKIKKRHQVEKDAQRLVAGVWLYLLCFSS